ncbi:MAG: hypothetical protein OXH68_04465 [Gammaproteobacteria bacterium]|nr:hypothetical protein [Gammaproteobacteria bacterium]
MQTASTRKQPTIARRILRLLKNDALIAAVAVLAVSFVACFGVAVITWLTYRERYGVGFLEYLRIFL